MSPANELMLTRIRQQIRRAAEAEGKAVTLCVHCRTLLVSPPATCPKCGAKV